MILTLITLIIVILLLVAVSIPLILIESIIWIILLVALITIFFIVCFLIDLIMYPFRSRNAKDKIIEKYFKRKKREK